ncbi:MAG: TA system VapC family ribonuclease toxin [Verrucomicrobiia bacterium]
MTFLMDTNALIALAWENHEHHKAAAKWFRAVSAFATCPITQGGFVRISSNSALGFANEPADAFRSLDSIVADRRHEFWPDDLSFCDCEIQRPRIRSHARITDHYLVGLARRHKGALATFDIPLERAFAAEPDLVHLIR